MNSEGDNLNRGVLSLVQYCQRVAANHVDSISSLGHMSYDLIKPILERCSADTLLRLELASPHLQEDTQGKLILDLRERVNPNRQSLELWKDLCYRVYPGMMERFSEETMSSPKSWRKHYYVLREAEAKRLEEIGSRIRSQRLEAEGRKKEREVKFTDRLPPPKRAKTWGAPVQPKTLFQKTRSEASKIQKNMYHARIIPPMPKSKDYSSTRPSPSPSRIALLPPASAEYASRVTVNTVRRPSISTSISTTTPKNPTAILEKTQLLAPSHSTTSVSPACPMTHADDYQNKDTLSSPAAPTQPGSSPLKSSPAFKKDPMATLFVPKHRAYSQRTR